MSTITKFASEVIDAFELTAAALSKAEQTVNQKEAAERAYSDRIQSVVEKCAQYGRIDDTVEDRQKLQEWLSTPQGALEVVEKLAMYEDKEASSIGGTEVDSRGNSVKRASADTFESGYVGRRSSDKPESWKAFERGIGLI